MTLNRRSLIAGLLVTPAIVRYSSLMKLAPQQPLIGKLEYPASAVWVDSTPGFILRVKVIDKHGNLSGSFTEIPEHQFFVEHFDTIKQEWVRFPC